MPLIGVTGRPMGMKLFGPDRDARTKAASNDNRPPPEIIGCDAQAGLIASRRGTLGRESGDEGRPNGRRD